MLDPLDELSELIEDWLEAELLENEEAELLAGLLAALLAELLIDCWDEERALNDDELEVSELIEELT